VKRSWILMGLVLVLPPVAITLLLNDGIGSARSAHTQREASAKPFAPPQQLSSDGQASLRAIIQAGSLSDLRWPNFSDYQKHVQRFYESYDYSLPWVRSTELTPQAQKLIAVLLQAEQKGLTAEDYDGPRWSARLARLQPAAPRPSETDSVRFDVALTVCVMRYISDLRIGRANPRQFGFGISVEQKKYDLAQFVRDRLSNVDDVNTALAEVEPPFPGYKRTQAALQHYLKLMNEDNGEKLPEATKSIDPGKEYSGVSRLASLLRLLGDLPTSADLPSGDVYQGSVVDALKHFQRRHGLAPDGRLGPQTVQLLNTPLSKRVEQLQLTLERWRWLPSQFVQPPVIVNIPEFRLRAFGKDGTLAFSTNVIVGKAYRHETPVFEDDMQYVVFRPYWNVPPGIQRSEIVPAIQRDQNYVFKNNYEVVTRGGDVVTSGAISEEVLRQLRAGTLTVRQKPGPTNALGLVKLIFPNAHNVYLHSTPSQQLFSQSRRDFSHGCIRVEKADQLAAWALSSDNQEWTVERVRAAMDSQADNVQVNLAKPIPVLILYATAIIDQDGIAHFFEDIYGHDAALQKVLAKGYPYPH
jgi:L,D-transpeptidase YcbB